MNQNFYTEGGDSGTSTWSSTQPTANNTVTDDTGVSYMGLPTSSRSTWGESIGGAALTDVESSMPSTDMTNTTNPNSSGLNSTVRRMDDHRFYDFGPSTLYQMSNRQIAKLMVARAEREKTPPRETANEKLLRRDRNDLWRFIQDNKVTMRDIDEMGSAILEENYSVKPLKCLDPELVLELQRRKGEVLYDHMNNPPKVRQHIVVDPQQYAQLKRTLNTRQMLQLASENQTRKRAQEALKREQAKHVLNLKQTAAKPDGATAFDFNISQEMAANILSESPPPEFNDQYFDTRFKYLADKATAEGFVSDGDMTTDRKSLDIMDKMFAELSLNIDDDQLCPNKETREQDAAMRKAESDALKQLQQQWPEICPLPSPPKSDFITAKEYLDKQNARKRDNTVLLSDESIDSLGIQEFVQSVHRAQTIDPHDGDFLHRPSAPKTTTGAIPKRPMLIGDQQQNVSAANQAGVQEQNLEEGYVTPPLNNTIASQPPPMKRKGEDEGNANKKQKQFENIPQYDGASEDETGHSSSTPKNRSDRDQQRFQDNNRQWRFFQEDEMGRNIYSPDKNQHHWGGRQQPPDFGNISPIKGRSSEQRHHAEYVHRFQQDMKDKARASRHHRSMHDPPPPLPPRNAQPDPRGSFVPPPRGAQQPPPNGAYQPPPRGAQQPPPRGSNQDNHYQQSGYFSQPPPVPPRNAPPPGFPSQPPPRPPKSPNSTYPADTTEDYIRTQNNQREALRLEKFRRERDQLEFQESLKQSEARAKFYEQLYEKAVESRETEVPRLQGDLPKLRMKTTQEEQLGLVMDKCDTDKSNAQTQQLMLSLIRHLADNKPRDETFNHLWMMTNEKITTQSQQAQTKTAQLAGTKVMATLYKSQLQRPKTVLTSEYDSNTIKMLQPHNIMSAIKAFNPDKDPEADFTDTWRYVMSYTKNTRLTEQAYINILCLILQGGAHKTIHDLTTNDASLDEILTTLSDLYCHQRTMADDMRELKEFKRRAGEPIKRTMSRAKLMAEKIKHFFSTASWPEQCERTLTSILKQVISRNTRQHIELEEMKLLRLGVVMDYKAMLDMADSYETAHDEIPKEEVKTTVNAYSGVPTKLDDNFNVNPEKDISSKLDRLEEMVINLNSVEHKSEKSHKLKHSSKFKTGKLSSHKSRSGERSKPYDRNKSSYKSSSQPMETQESHTGFSYLTDNKRKDEKYKAKVAEELQKKRENYNSTYRPNRNFSRSQSRSPFRKSYQNSRNSSASSYKSYNSESKSDNESSSKPYSRSGSRDSRSSWKDRRGRSQEKQVSFTKNSGKTNYNKHSSRDNFRRRQQNRHQSSDNNDYERVTVNHTHYYKCSGCAVLVPENTVCPCSKNE